MKDQLKSRQLEIIRNLVASGTPLQISYFTDKLKKSERTIRYDINIIRQVLQEYDIDVKSIAKKGFYIPVSQKQKCTMLLQEKANIQESMMLEDHDTSRNQTLLLFFMMQKQSVTATTLADVFFVSRSTMLRMIHSFNEISDHMVIQSDKNAGYSLKGDEFSIRQEASSICYELFKGSYTVEDWYLLLPSMFKKSISFQKLMDISEAIKKINSIHNVWVSNISFMRLFSYCLVRCLRLQHQKTKICNHVSNYEYVKDLIMELDVDHQVLNQQECIWLTKVLNENGIHVETTKEDHDNMHDILKEVMEIVHQHTGFKFNETALYNDLYLHFQHYFRKECLYQQEDNPLIKEIQNNYKEYYALAKKCSKAFDTNDKKGLSENELSYLAIYLYKNAEHEKRKKRVVVVCATGKGLSNLLSTRIKNVFSELQIVEQVSPYQAGNLYKWKDIDFVISTIPLQNCLYPVVKISRILTKEDIHRIQEFMHYGKLMDSIPVANPNVASIYGEHDPFDLSSIEFDSKRENLGYASVILSKLMLTLLEYTSKLPKNYEMNQDALLGLIIHMNMAVPRWFHPESIQSIEEMEEAYYNIKEQHQSVFELMEKFFSLVEESLLISIPVNERAAFFLYIIHEEDST